VIRPSGVAGRLAWVRHGVQADRSPVSCADGAGPRELSSIVVVVAGNSGVERIPAVAAGLDSASAEWLRVLGGTSPGHESALERLHAMLVRIARREVARRGPRLRVTGPELEDLAYQAAADALVAITGKLGPVPRGGPVHHLGV